MVKGKTAEWGVSWCVLLATCCSGDQDEIGKACGMYCKDKKCIWDFDGENCRKETTWM